MYHKNSKNICQEETQNQNDFWFNKKAVQLKWTFDYAATLIFKSQNSSYPYTMSLRYSLHRVISYLWFIQHSAYWCGFLKHKSLRWCYIKSKLDFTLYLVWCSTPWEIANIWVIFYNCFSNFLLTNIIR